MGGAFLLHKILERIKRLSKQTEESLSDALGLIVQLEDKQAAREWLSWVRSEARAFKSLKAYDLIRKSYFLAAQYGDFDSYCIALEWNRSPEKRFYLPRRQVLKTLVDDLQDLFDGNLDFLGVSLPPRVGKSTLCIFFMTFVMGNRPGIANVMSGHSDKLTDGFYRELLSIITDNTQYAWQEIFPHVKIVDNSAKNETIDLERKKRFPTMTCRSISGTLTGAVEIGTGGVLYCDDLIEDLEESLNPVRLQNKYDAYLNQLKDRKKLGAVELMVGTRWNVADPLGRIEEQYRDNPRYRFRVIPALNDAGESNFNYKYDLGFDTEYYRDMKESIDDATWMAKYMGNPYVREGLLFPAEDLRYYNGVLPDGEPDMVAAVVDTAWGGGDSLSLPIVKVYGSDYYIDDVVFNNGDKTVTRPIVIGKLKQHKPHMVRWESNNGGDEYGGIVDEKLREDGVRINMSYKKAPTNQSKLSRIIQFAPDIKRLYFLDDKHRSSEYEKFMRELTMFTVSGKNLHDDAPDSLAMLVDFITTGNKVVTVAKRPF
jgi:predicted phage terminase large subunit-like protein